MPTTLPFPWWVGSVGTCGGTVRRFKVDGGKRTPSPSSSVCDRKRMERSKGGTERNETMDAIERGRLRKDNGRMRWERTAHATTEEVSQTIQSQVDGRPTKGRWLRRRSQEPSKRKRAQLVSKHGSIDGFGSIRVRTRTPQVRTSGFARAMEVAVSMELETVGYMLGVELRIPSRPTPRICGKSARKRCANVHNVL